MQSYPRIQTWLTVVYCTQLSPRIRRITLGGEDLRHFPPGVAGSYLKLRLPAECDEEAAPRVRLRTYTIRAYRPEQREIDLEITLHTDGVPGPGARWAAEAKPGDSVEVSGPGQGTMADPSADWYLFVGDLTAVPAISANLEQLAPDARGAAVLQASDVRDRLPVQAPAGIDVHWVGGGCDLGVESPLLERVRGLPWLAGQPFVWAACDYDQMRLLRDYFKRERGLSSRDLYISSYWKPGLREEEHKRVKKQDAEANPV